MPALRTEGEDCVNVRDWLRIIWHTRPGHVPHGVIETRRGLYCAACGKDLSR